MITKSKHAVGEKIGRFCYLRRLTGEHTLTQHLGFYHTTSSPSLPPPSAGPFMLPLLIHHYPRIVTWENSVSSCSGCAMAGWLPLCRNSSSVFASKNQSRWQAEWHRESKVKGNQSIRGWGHISAAITTCNQISLQNEAANTWTELRPNRFWINSLVCETFSHHASWQLLLLEPFANYTAGWRVL